MKHAYKSGAIVYPEDPKGDGWLYVTGAWIKKFLAAARANAPYTKPNSGIKTTVTDDGLLLEADFRSITSAITPLYAANSSSESGTAIRVYYGTLGGRKIVGMSLGDSPPLIVSVSGTGVLYAECEITSSIISADPTVSSASSIPADDLTLNEDLTFDGTVYLEIASFSTVSGVFSVARNLTGSQEVAICGGLAAWGVI